MELGDILDAFEDALELERELGHRIVECDRSLLVSQPSTLNPQPPTSNVKPQTQPSTLNPQRSTSQTSKHPNLPNVQTPQTSQTSQTIKQSNNPTIQQSNIPRPDFAFLLECEPSGPVAELLPKMSEAIGYGRDGVKINDPSAKVLIVLGREALQKWLPGVKAIPGQWVKRGETPALVTASPTKTFRFFANDAEKILALKRRLWTDLKAALAKIGKTPPPRKA